MRRNRHDGAAGQHGCAPSATRHSRTVHRRRRPRAAGRRRERDATTACRGRRGDGSCGRSRHPTGGSSGRSCRSPASSNPGQRTDHVALVSARVREGEIGVRRSDQSVFASARQPATVGDQARSTRCRHGWRGLRPAARPRLARSAQCDRSRRSRAAPSGEATSGEAPPGWIIVRRIDPVSSVKSICPPVAVAAIRPPGREGDLPPRPGGDEASTAARRGSRRPGVRDQGRLPLCASRLSATKTAPATRTAALATLRSFTPDFSRPARRRPSRGPAARMRSSCAFIIAGRSR